MKITDNEWRKFKFPWRLAEGGKAILRQDGTVVCGSLICPVGSGQVRDHRFIMRIIKEASK